MADQIRIRELTETNVIDDSSFLAIDYENETHKVSVGNFNSNANATAKRYAEQAAASATEASGYATAAAATVDEVDLQVTAAAASATAAAASATQAGGYSDSALGYANTAAGHANTADSRAQSAGNSATAAGESATLARSWAVGGTSSRTGEDTNNARYWADVAAAAAGGGVTSWNGRGGAVTPQSGDYTAAMVGAAAATDVYTKSEVYTKNEVYSKSEVYPKADVDTAVAAAAAAGVTSYKNRVGAVVPAYGDYTEAMVNATDTYGLLGNAGATSDGQTLLDDIANRVLNQLVYNSTFQNTIANYVAKSMITDLATHTQPKESVLDGTEKNPSVSGSLAEAIAGKAPTSHASSATTYGRGSASNYGHVKLSDGYTSSGGNAAGGVGASSKAVYDAYTALNESLSNISDLGHVYSGVAQNGRTISMSGNNCRGIIFGCSTVENRTFITFIYSAATGAWNHVDIQKGSNITISGDTTTTLSITSSSSVLTSCRIISWGGELTVSNPS